MMAGIKKKIMPVSKSMSGNEFVNFNPDYSIALEYTGSPISNSMLLKVLPVDIDSIPTAKIAVSPAIMYNLSLPVAEPIVRSNFRGKNGIRLGSRADDSMSLENCVENRVVDEVLNGEFVMNGDLQDRVESSGTLGFSGSSEGDSNELSESSDMLEIPIGVNEIEELNEQRSRSMNFGGGFCEEEVVSDGEHLDHRRKRRGVVTFRDHESSDFVVVPEDSMFSDEGFSRERPVPVRPPKKGMCYHCHRGSRFTEKEACLVCDAKYCSRCIRKAMGSMPEGRKCLTCIGFPVEESKRKTLGKSSRILRGWLQREEVKQIMEAEVLCVANQLSSEYILVNGRPLSVKELMVLRSCQNPPRNLKPGSYWYDRVSGFWGKEGHKPCQIITPSLNIGGKNLNENASNGNAKVTINGREITKVEKFVLKSAGIMCEGNPAFWLEADGTYSEVGMNVVRGNIWGKKRTKIWCTLLSLPTPVSPNPRRQSNNATEELSNYLLRKVLLVGNDSSGTSTIYKQARVLYDKPFSEEERQSIKFMIQSNFYGYLARLLEGREMFEEERLSEMRNSQTTDPGPSDSNGELEQITEYSIGKKLKVFSDWLINGMVSSNLDLLFPAATREYALYVEELWKDAAIQATYSRRDELKLPRVASYFLDKAIDIAKVDYEPSDTDIMYAEGITSSNGLTSMEFQFPQQQDNDDNRDPDDQPDPVTRYQLIRVSVKSLGENCKWLQMFEDVEMVLFCVCLTDYDEYEVDGSGLLVNKMIQSKSLFESIVTHPTYKDMSFLLILNKFDLLEEKIEQVPLTQCSWFKDFNPVFSRHQNTRRSGNNIAPLAQRALHFIGVQYKKLFKSLTGRNLYVCPVTALESDTVDSALKYAREILKWEENKSGFSLHDISSESIETNSYDHIHS